MFARPGWTDLTKDSKIFVKENLVQHARMKHQVYSRELSRWVSGYVVGHSTEADSWPWVRSQRWLILPLIRHMPYTVYIYIYMLIRFIK